MKRQTYILLSILGPISCGLPTDKNSIKEVGAIQIEWLNNLQGDFLFKNNWIYP